jgi:Ser/Thr protein kinase RdoA (MazF antagonist)
LKNRVTSALLRRLRRRNWAKAALEQYGIQDARFAILKEGTNQRKLLFRVESPTRGRFVLRVYKLSRPSENLLPELLWLQALRREMPLSVPEPVPTIDGSLISHVSFKGASKPRRGVLLRWLPGRRKAVTDLSPMDLSLVGSRIGRLHRHCEQYEVPEGLVFPYVWGWDWVFGETAPLWQKGKSVYSQSEMDVFQAAGERVRHDLQELGKDSNVFGIIHRDLHLNNFLFHKGEAYAIDFETSGWGYYLFDLTVPLSILEGCIEHSAPMKAALLEGYQRERPLPEDHLRYLETFMAMRIVQKINMVLHWETPTQLPWGPAVLSSSMKGLEEFVASEGKARQVDLVSPWWRQAFR